MPTPLINDITGEITNEPISPAMQQMGGYTEPTVEQNAALQESTQYDQPLTAAALGFARANLPYASDKIIPMLGLDGLKEEDLIKLKENNKAASFVGEAVGYLNPLNPINKLAGSLKIPSMLATIAGEKAIPRILAHTAGSAIEGGAIYGTAQVLNEQALGDPELTAESVLGTLGIASAIGGAFGLIGATASHLLPAAVNKLSGSIKKLEDYTNDIEHTNIGAEPTFNEPKPVMPDIADIIVKKSPPPIPRTPPEPSEIPIIPDNLDEMVVKQRQQIARDLTDNLNEIKDNMDASTKQLHGDMKHQEASKFLVNIPVESVKPLASQTYDNLQKTVMDMTPLPAEYAGVKLGIPMGAIDGEYSTVLTKKLGQAAAKYEDAIRNAINTEDFFNAQIALKKELQQLSRYEKNPLTLDMPTRNSQEKIRELASSVRNSIRDTNYWGEAAARTSAIDDVLSGAGRENAGWFDFFDPKGSRTRFRTELLEEDLKGNYKFSAKKVERLLKTQDPDVLDHLREFSRTTNDLHDEILHTYSNTMAKPEMVKSHLEYMKELDHNINKSISEYKLTKEAAIEFKRSVKEKAAEISLMNKQEMKDFIERRDIAIKEWNQSHKEKIREVKETLKEKYSADKELYANKKQEFKSTRSEWADKKELASQSPFTPSALSGAAGKGFLAHLALSTLGVPSKLTKLISAGIAFHETATDPIRKISILRTLEGHLKTANKAIENTTKAIVNGSRKYGGSIAGATSASINEHRENDKRLLNTFGRRVELINSFLNDDNVTSSRMSAFTGGIHDHAPQTSDMLQSKAVIGAMFLKSKIPTHQDMGPLSKEWQYSNAEIAKFNRYYDAVNKPEIILKQAAAGTMTKESLEVLTNVYPALYRQIQSSLLDKMTDKTTPSSIPYQSKLMISMLLGSPQMVSMMQKTISSIQQSYAQPQIQQSGGMKQHQVKIDQNSWKSMMTPMQKASNR